MLWAFFFSATIHRGSFFPHTSISGDGLFLFREKYLHTCPHSPLHIEGDQAKKEGDHALGAKKTAGPCPVAVDGGAAGERAGGADGLGGPGALGIEKAAWHTGGRFSFRWYKPSGLLGAVAGD